MIRDSGRRGGGRLGRALHASMRCAGAIGECADRATCRRRRQRGATVLASLHGGGASAPPRPRRCVDATTECNIIYSSGTTGLPKGIVHTHGCRCTGHDLAIALRYHSGAVTVCSLGLYSNISWVAMLCTMLAGGTIVIMPSFTPAALADDDRSALASRTAASCRCNSSGSWNCRAAERDFSSLQAIMCCGSPLPPALKRADARTLDCELIELYGLTEGIVTTLAPEDFERAGVRRQADIRASSSSSCATTIARPARGELGEICGHGRLVMEGYHNRPDATAEATWTDARGRRWLRTGDIGRLDDEGFLYIVDRKKDMILSGSQNVYPADIEVVMLRASVGARKSRSSAFRASAGAKRRSRSWWRATARRIDER